jgi:hypothetical protein
LFDTEQVQGDAGPHDVADGINGADLVKVDFLKGDVVRPGLRFAQAMKDSEGVVTGALGQIARRDDFFDVREVTVFLLFFEIDGEFPGSHTLSLCFLKGQRRAELKTFESRAGGFPIRSGIQQSADGHVAGNA